MFWFLRWGAFEILNHQVRALEGEGADSELLFFLQAQVAQVTEVIQAVQVAQVKAVDPGVRWGQGMEGGRWMVATICCPGAGGVATGASLPRHRPPTHRRNSLLPLAKPATIWNQDSDFLSTFCKTCTTTFAICQQKLYNQISRLKVVSAIKWRDIPEMESEKLIIGRSFPTHASKNITPCCCWNLNDVTLAEESPSKNFKKSFYFERGWPFWERYE